MEKKMENKKNSIILADIPQNKDETRIQRVHNKDRK